MPRGVPKEPKAKVKPDKAPAAPKAKKSDWPKKFKVGFTPYGRPIVVTEVRRPEPQAVLILKTGAVVELTQEEHRILLHQESGALIPSDVLTPVAAEQDSGKGEKGQEGVSGGESSDAAAEGAADVTAEQ